MAWMRWNYREMKRFALRSKIGLVLGLILGTVVSYLYWTKSDALSIGTMTYATYPLHLIFGCEVPFYGLIILVLIYSIVGLCLDGIISKWQISDDRNRSLIILAVLIIVLGGIYYYKDVNNKLCFDVDRNGIPDVSATTDSDGDGVMDINDLCPNTPAGTTVDSTGCSTTPPAGCIYIASTCPTWSTCATCSQYCTVANCTSITKSCGNCGTTSGIDFEVTIT